MTIKDHDNSVSRFTDTDGTKINAAETKRVLAVARRMQAKDPEMLKAWVRAVEREAAKQKKE